jgi:hypothetical protein
MEKKMELVDRSGNKKAYNSGLVFLVDALQRYTRAEGMEDWACA